MRQSFRGFCTVATYSLIRWIIHCRDQKIITLPKQETRLIRGRNRDVNLPTNYRRSTRECTTIFLLTVSHFFFHSLLIAVTRLLLRWTNVRSAYTRMVFINQTGAKKSWCTFRVRYVLVVRKYKLDQTFMLLCSCNRRVFLLANFSQWRIVPMKSFVTLSDFFCNFSLH